MRTAVKTPMSCKVRQNLKFWTVWWCRGGKLAATWKFVCRKLVFQTPPASGIDDSKMYIINMLEAESREYYRYELQVYAWPPILLHAATAPVHPNEFFMIRIIYICTIFHHQFPESFDFVGLFMTHSMLTNSLLRAKKDEEADGENSRIMREIKNNHNVLKSMVCSTTLPALDHEAFHNTIVNHYCTQGIYS